MSYEPRNLKLWTHPSSYAGEVWPDYYGSSVGQSRDSDCREQSNFAAMLKLLGGESETVIVVREGHWVVGWVEWIAIHASDDKALEAADEAADQLADYPVLDEDDWSEREQEEANNVWRDCYSPQERVDYIRRHQSQFEFHDYADMLACVRGQFFAGYASELLN